MSENKSTAQIANASNMESSVNVDNALTEREIFEKIAELQKKLTESPYHTLSYLSASISSICDSEGEEQPEQIREVCNVFSMRETTFQMMIEFYQKMYNNLKN